MEKTVDTPRKRNENWTQNEFDELRAAYLEYREILEGRLSPCLSAKDKDKAWSTIVSRVNAMGCCDRTIQQCRKKLSDMRSQVKKKERTRRRLAGATGGGPAPVLEKWEEDILQVMGETSIIGFSGIDSFSCNTDSLDKPSTLQTTTTSICSFEQSHIDYDDSLNGPSPAKQQKQSSYNINLNACCSNAQTKETVQSEKPKAPTDESSACKKKSKHPKRVSMKQDDRQEVLQLIKQQTDIMQKLLEETKKTNHILGQLFAVDIERIHSCQNY